MKVLQNSLGILISLFFLTPLVRAGGPSPSRYRVVYKVDGDLEVREQVAKDLRVTRCLHIVRRDLSRLSALDLRIGALDQRVKVLPIDCTDFLAHLDDLKLKMSALGIEQRQAILALQHLQTLLGKIIELKREAGLQVYAKTRVETKMQEAHPLIRDVFLARIETYQQHIRELKQKIAHILLELQQFLFSDEELKELRERISDLRMTVEVLEDVLRVEEKKLSLPLHASEPRLSNSRRALRALISKSRRERGEL